MSIFDRILELAITIVVIIGGYQFYFWAQRRRWFEPYYPITRFDGMIKYNPHWVWIYSGLYYPMILLASVSIDSWEQYNYTVGCFLLLLGIQIQFFLFFPVAIPQQWRDAARIPWEGTLSQRFMDLVWCFDKLRNSLPSMHVSIATMVDLTIWKHWPTLGHICILFPVLIAISALKTKQHYVVDVIPGALLAIVVFWAWNTFLLPLLLSSTPM